MHLIIDSEYDENTLKEIDRGLQFLLSTPKGSYPLDREFGIDYAFLDKPAPVAANMLAAELKDTIPAMDPRVQLDHVEVERDDMTGTLKPTIYLKENNAAVAEEEEESDE